MTRDRHRNRAEGAPIDTASWAEVTSDIVARFDREVRHLYVNPAVTAATGLAPEAFIGKTNEQLGMPDEQCRLWRDAVNRAFETRQPVSFDLSFPSGDDLMYFSGQAVPEPGQDGEVRTVLCVNRDMTAQKRTEQKLQRSREDLKHAQAVAHVGSWRLDPERRALLWSEETYRIFGIPQGTPMTYEAFLDAVHPEDREDVRRAWTAALGGAPYDIEHRILAGGAVRWVREQAELEVDRQGKARGGFGTVQDITRRRQIEQALRESEAQLRKAMIAGGVFSFEWDPVSDQVLRSDNCAAMLGLDPATCTAGTAKAHFEHVADEDREALRRLILSLRPEDPEYETEYRYVRDDGRTIWLEESGRAEFDAQGTMVRLIGIAADVTDRVTLQERETEAAVAAGAAQSAVDTVNAMGEGVILSRLDGTVTAVNPAALSLTGLDRHRLVGRSLRIFLKSFLDDDDLVMAERAFAEVAEGRVPELTPVVIRRREGPPVTLSPSVTFITDSDDVPVTAVLTLKDVTELHQSNELLRQVFDNTHMQIAYLDLDFNFVRVNRAYADTCGHDPEFFVGKNHFVLYPDEENEQIFRTARDSGEPFTVYEKPFEFPDQPDRGVTYWDWSVRPLQGAGGEAEGLLFCLLDVTERVQARQRLLQSEQKYRELVESANNIIMRLATDHRILFVNEYAQNFFGYSADEIVGKSVIGTITPEVDSEGRDLRRMVQQVAAHPEMYGSSENENMCRDGRRVWVHWSNRAIRDERGEVRELLCVGTDVTERKQLEREADAYRLRLRGLANRLAATEEQERRRVATQIHDTVIQTLSLANIRLGGVRGAVKAAGLDEAVGKVERVRKLLDSGIAECRGLMADLTPPLLYELGLTAALTDFAEKQASLHERTIAVDEEAGLPSLDEARRGLLFQCARELLMNAIKYAGASDIRVRLYGADGYVFVEVADKGDGFDPAAADVSDADQEGGFGLFNIRERLQGLGGALELESAPGQGTTATVRLPAE